MKRRVRRVTLAAAVLGVGIIAVLVVAHWATTRDHVEAWRFQLTRETKTIEPWPRSEGQPELTESSTHVLWLLAISARIPIVFDPANVPRGLSLLGWESEPGWYIVKDADPATADGPIYEETGSTPRILHILSVMGCRIIEQRFPRRAYVVILDEESAPSPVYPILEHGQR